MTDDVHTLNEPIGGVLYYAHLKRKMTGLSSEICGSADIKDKEKVSALSHLDICL
jgi:hypothetical protein